MIFVVEGIFGQNSASLKQKITIPTFTNADFPKLGDTTLFNGCFSSKKILKFYRKPICDSLPNIPFSFLNNYPINIIAPNYYTQNFGFFCKKELQLQKALKVPFVFRLGSVEICDRLEGKER